MRGRSATGARVDRVGDTIGSRQGTRSPSQAGRVGGSDTADEQVPRPRPGRPTRLPGHGSRSGSMRRPGSALTVLAAPAGFGKTTLLTEWLATLPPGAPSVAWLSLDRRDNDPSLFWTYVVTAMRTAVDGLGSDALQLLASSSPSTEAALAALLNDLGGRPEDLLLILDDYHLIEAPDVHEGMTFLLEHRPPQLHVVLATRTDPPLPLARMRARGQLVRGAGGGPSLHRRGVRGVPQRPDGTRAQRGRPRGAGRAHRRVDRCPAAGRAVDAGARRRQRVHRRVRRRRPLRRGLSRRGGPRPPARRRPRLPAPDVDPRAAHRPALRRGHGTGRRQGDPAWRSSAPTCSSSRSTTGGSGTGTTTCSPTSSTPTCSTSTPDEVPELHRRASVWFEANGDSSAGDRPRAGRR